MTKNNLGFLLKGLAFLLPLIVLVVVVEARLSKKQNTYNEKRKYFEPQLKDINVLVLGSSQALFGIDPDSFPVKGFNLANVSQDIDFDATLTMKYLDSMPKLKMVVLPISYFSLCYQLKNTKNPTVESWRLFYYYQYWDIKKPEMSMWDSKCYSKYMLYSPLISVKYLCGLLPPDDKVRVNGYLPNDSLVTKKELRVISPESGKARVELHNKIIAAGNKKEVINDLTELIRKLSERHVKISFVTIPVSNSYSQYCDTNILQSNKQEIALLCKQYNASFFDYFTDNRFSNTDFADNDHLNPEGAAKFSGILNKEVVTPALANIIK